MTRIDVPPELLSRHLGVPVEGPLPDREEPPRYAFPETALRKWAGKRLSIDAFPDDRLSAKFRFDGSTCTNMGIPFAFDLTVVLRAESAGTHLIEACTALPAAGDRGHRAMCGYLDGADSFLATISTFKLPVGRTLDEMVEWAPNTSPAGCVCTPTNMNHKWQIVLQTLHFALRNGEGLE